MSMDFRLSRGHSQPVYYLLNVFKLLLRSRWSVCCILLITVMAVLLWNALVSNTPKPQTTLSQSYTSQNKPPMFWIYHKTVCNIVHA